MTQKGTFVGALEWLKDNPSRGGGELNGNDEPHRQQFKPVNEWPRRHIASPKPLKVSPASPRRQRSDFVSPELLTPTRFTLGRRRRVQSFGRTKIIEKRDEGR